MVAFNQESPIFDEQCWLLKDVKKHVAGAPEGDTLRNWATNGAKNPQTGRIVYLETIWNPKGRTTSDGAIKRFIKNLNSPTYTAVAKKPFRKSAPKHFRPKTRKAKKNS